MVGIFMTVKMEPRKMDNYTIPEASKYIRAPYTTVLSWVKGDPKYPIFQIDKKPAGPCLSCISRSCIC